MQLEEGLRKREEHDEGKDRHLLKRRNNNGWNLANHGALNYERWVKLIALGSLSIWLIFVLSFWHAGVAPALVATTTKNIYATPAQMNIYPQETNFIALGDFGTGDENQGKVALALEKFLATMHPPPAFVLSTGDQIYDHGIESAKDTLLSLRFEQMYRSRKLQIPWYITIGNHDCEGSIDAMLEYAKTKNSLWHLPRRYYSVDHPVAPKTIVRLIVIDACDLVCGREPRDFRCTQSMNDQTSVASRQSQYDWIEQTLSASKPLGVERMWTIVMGHWAVYSFAGNGDTPELIDKLDPLLMKYKVHAYFNGHDHSLQHIKKVNDDGSVRNYFISGAGGYSIHTLKPNARANPELIHAALKYGFMTVHITPTYFRVQFVDNACDIIYTTDVRYE